MGTNKEINILLLHQKFYQNQLKVKEFVIELVVMNL